MDMKKILQAMDGASTKPVEGSSSMAKFLRVVKEAEAQVIDGPNGMKTTINPDGTKTVSDGSGTKTYDAQGQLVTTATPNLVGVQKTTDVKSGDVTTDYNQGPMSVSQTQTPGGYTKQSNTQYDLGMAAVGQQKTGPNIAAGQLAGTTTNTVTDKTTGQAKQQIQGVGFGGASGPNVGKNYVGASDDELIQHAQNSVTGANPAEDMQRLRKLSGITEKDIEEADMNQPPKGVNFGPEYLQKVVNGQLVKSLISPEMAQAALDWLAANPNYTPPAPAAKPVAAEPAQTLSQHYQANPNIREGLQGNGLIKQYFESVQTEAEQAFDQRRAKIKEQARRIAQRMREDAKVSALDPAKKTITYTDDKTGISTTIPQAMAKPGEGGQVTVDKSQVNQAASQDQQPQPVKVGDMVKMMDTESSSAGVRMHRALQREKERREYSQRYAEKNFPIGKKPEPIKEPQKDQPAAENDTHQIKGNELIEYLMKRFDMTREQAIELLKKKGLAEGKDEKIAQLKKDYDTAVHWSENERSPQKREAARQKAEKIKAHLEKQYKQGVAEGNEDPSWISNLRLRK